MFIERLDHVAHRYKTNDPHRLAATLAHLGFDQMHPYSGELARLRWRHPGTMKAIATVAIRPNGELTISGTASNVGRAAAMILSAEAVDPATELPLFSEVR